MRSSVLQGKKTVRRLTIVLWPLACLFGVSLAAYLGPNRTTAAGQGEVASAPRRFVDIPVDVLEDKIRGGMLGQIIGNLNGGPHEGKYFETPGTVERYTPALPDGAWTDDDTDIEWVYVTAMARTDTVYLPPETIVKLWRSHVNRGIWMSNRYARQLMDLGIDPPLTGRILINPWAEYNVSGHFVCETFGLIAPGMPQTASRIGLHYTHVSVDAEPSQSTQLFDSMIAVAFFENDIEKILLAGLAAVDPASGLYRLVKDVHALWKENPQDWRTTRQKIRSRYERYGPREARDWAGTELNTAAIVAALLYGKGDFVETLRLAFNFGWDADCNAATAGTVVGVMKGRRWMNSQEWVIRDIYRNTRRDAMPLDETISSFENKVIAVAKRIILQAGGRENTASGRKVLSIPVEKPAVVELLPNPPDRRNELRAALLPQIARWIHGSERDRARAAYLAIALDEYQRYQKERPAQWAQALDALRKYPNVIREIFAHIAPSAKRIQDSARAAGLEPLPATTK